MKKKLEDFFDVEGNESEQNNDFAVEKATEEITELEKHNNEMQEISQKAIKSFEEIMQRSDQVDDKDAGKIYSAASDMLKNAISANNSKIDARIKSTELAAKLKKIYNDSNEEENNIKKLTRAEILNGENNDNKNNK